ncbi:hypothetical protein WS72_18490 [Burkholderia savannae]|uniref:Uncharacterized protein n=1 Tax=Burkholderia savannae TaxID=1637837 RepID=A0ABR5T8Q1_9BURK|nr:hypothetical protein WS72_18490 [Burkholderia savannae]
MQHGVLRNLLLERIRQRLQLHTAGADPLCECGARNRQAGALKDAFLSVQRNVIVTFAHEDLREQPGGGDALVDHLGRHRCLDQRLALLAHPLAAHVTLDGKDAGRVIQLLADVFADPLELTPARARGGRRLVTHFHARQIRRQRRAARLVRLSVLLRSTCELLELLLDGDQVRVDGLV